MFYELLPIIVFVIALIAFGFWVLTPRKIKLKKLLACPKTGVMEINPNGNDHCTECAKRYAGII